MKTQKEALKNLLQSYKLSGNINKELFISFWLEDINWHTENRMFVEKTNLEKSIEYATADKEWTEESKFNELYPMIHVFNNIFGWGLEDIGTERGWNFGSGMDFVDELIELIEEVNK